MHPCVHLQVIVTSVLALCVLPPTAFAAMPQETTSDASRKEKNGEVPNSSLTEKQLNFFETRIRPVLVEHCYSCHNSADQQDSALALDHRTATMRGGSGGPIIVAGDPAASRLIDILKHDIEGFEMPEDGPKLDAIVISDFETWIRMGAPDPRNIPPTAEQLAATISWEAQRERRKQWWSFQPIAEVPTPSGKGNPVDLFIRSQLAEVNLKHAPRAKPVVLIRRLFLTLTGLPPTRQQLLQWQERYESGQSNSETTDQLIDTLLSSKHFGERWTRHWLDWIRYAESHGSEGDPAIENAWVYRDYLIRALNDDIPYDTLVREHIAGDLLPEPRINPDVPLAEEAPTDTIHIPANAKNKEDAKKFLAYLARADVQTQINDTLGQLPINSGSSVGDDKFLQAGYEMLSSTTGGIAQFFDRDAPAEMAKAGMEGFQEFMVKPERLDAILERLEKVRGRVYK